jgi:hypothetical protein
MMQQLASLNKNGGKVVLWLLILCMFGFTIVRSLHFLQQTLPADQTYVAFLALAAFDIGVLGWLYYAMHSASGVNQRVIAYGMIFICSGGVIATTVADMLMVSAANGVISKQPSYIGTIALWAVMLVIALNFLSGILVHLVDTKHAKHMAVESARDQITAASLAAIVTKAAEIAPRIAERVAQEWENDVIREMVGHLPPASSTPLLPASLPQTVESTLEPVPAAAPDVAPTQQPANAPIPPFASKKRYRQFHTHASQAPGAQTTSTPQKKPLEAAPDATKKNKLPRTKHVERSQPAGTLTS